MAARQTLVVVGVVVVAALAVVAPAASATAVATVDGALAGDAAVGGTAQTTADGATATQPENESANDSAFGTQMAAFMQSNAAQVNDSVEDGMWEAAFERANESERARMAHDRADELQGQLNALAQRNHTLSQRYSNGSLSYEEYVVAASQLNGRMAALEDGVSGTARAAERAGVNDSTLSELRDSTSNLTGPQVAGVARGLVDGDRGPPEGVPGRGPPGESDTDRPGGPPTDAPGADGTPGDGVPRGGNETAAGNGTESPDNAPDTPGNAPDDPGNAPDDPGAGR